MLEQLYFLNSRNRNRLLQEIRSLLDSGVLQPVGRETPFPALRSPLGHNFLSSGGVLSSHAGVRWVKLFRFVQLVLSCVAPVQSAFQALAIFCQSCVVLTSQLTSMQFAYTSPTRYRDRVSSLVLLRSTLYRILKFNLLRQATQLFSRAPNFTVFKYQRAIISQQQELGSCQNICRFICNGPQDRQ